MNTRATPIAADSLKRLACNVLVAAGMLEEYAQIVAEVLVWADLRGVPSHGVSRLARYIEMIKSGEMNPCPRMRYASEGPVISILDADRAAGPVAMTHAMNDAVKKAKASGASIVLVRATTHTAALGFYTQRAASEGALAVAIAASGPNMLYYGARRAGVSTSPISIASPGSDGTPILFDMGTAAISLGKLAQLTRNGETVPANSAADKDGIPTTDPSRAIIPLPIAGPKGSGLSLMIEILTSILVSNPILSDALDGTVGGKRHRQNALVMAIDIGALCDVRLFGEEIRRLTAAIKSLPREAVDAEIILPGERGDAAFKRNTANGISLSSRAVQNLECVASDHGVSLDGLFADR